MTKYIQVFILILIFTGGLVAQQIHFRIVNIKTGLPEPMVKVTSLPEHRFITFSNDKGQFSQFIAKDDTIELSKDGFHHLMLKITAINFDSTQAVQVGLVPLAAKKGMNPAYKNLESFEYHFVHDTLGDNSAMKINVLENVQAVKQRSRSRDQSFIIGAVDLDSPPPVDDPKKTYKPRYRLIK